MQKKILSVVLSLFLVSVASTASADFFAELEISDFEINLGSAVAEDRGIANKGNNDGNVNVTDEIEGRNILIQGGANSNSVNDSLRGFVGCSNCKHQVRDGLGSTQYYLNAGNVATQINFDGENEGDFSFSTAGNLVVHDHSRTMTKTKRSN